VDINRNSIMLTRDRLNFSYETIDNTIPKTTQTTYIDDARNLDKVSRESIDLVATHPPYANIILLSLRRRAKV
jgi:hypothetical protein